MVVRVLIVRVAARLRAAPAVTALAACAALAVVSTLVVAAAPTYDPWAWLLWGREVIDGRLSTAEGPAFKPLAVMLCAALAPLGSAAPWCWVVLVRTASLLALWLAFRLGRRLADGSPAAGVLAAAAVGLCAGFPGYVATGQEPGLLLALALGGVEAWRSGRLRLALLCALGCALLRVEAWPFLAVAGALAWRRGALPRPWLAGAAVAIPALWLLPELWGSGDVLRSGARARIPNPGQPALADVPALAAIREAAELGLWPLWAGIVALGVAARRRVVTWSTLAPAAAGAAWVAIVAAMAQAGFSGEARYSMPGLALLGISGAVGLVLAGRVVASRRPQRRAPALAAGVAIVALVGVAAVPRVLDLRGLRASQAYQQQLSSDLRDAVRLAGGRAAVLACGTPIVGNLRGPLAAYRLDVEKRLVQFEARPPGVVFRSRLTARRAPEPAVGPEFVAIGRAGRWEVLRACRS